MLTPDSLPIVREQIANLLGPEAFNRLIGSVSDARQKGRLRFWQEQHLTNIARQTGIQIGSLDEFVEVFETAEPKVIPRGPWTREIFLRRIEESPYGGFVLDETPPSWFAEAWLINSVRIAISYDLARDVSKTGKLRCTKEWLAYLHTALSAEQLVALFLYIRDERSCQFRESEFRPEFEHAFPKCVDHLPVPYPDVPFPETWPLPEKGMATDLRDTCPGCGLILLCGSIFDALDRGKEFGPILGLDRAAVPEEARAGYVGISSLWMGDDPKARFLYRCPRCGVDCLVDVND